MYHAQFSWGTLPVVCTERTCLQCVQALTGCVNSVTSCGKLLPELKRAHGEQCCFGSHLGPGEPVETLCLSRGHGVYEHVDEMWTWFGVGQGRGQRGSNLWHRAAKPSAFALQPEQTHQLVVPDGRRQGRGRRGQWRIGRHLAKDLLTETPIDAVVVHHDDYDGELRAYMEK